MGSVNLPWDVSDAELAWADEQLKAHPHLPTIVTSHQIINITGSGEPESTDFGQKLWDEDTAPTCEADYPEVDGTIAHWRREAKDGKVQYTDITGNGNDMTQKSTGGSAKLVDAAPENSAAPRAVPFDPGANFETGDDAPINNEKFEDGYTFETFINIDENFSEDNHWMGFISRFGMRSQLDNLNTVSDLDEPPAQGAISSLREIQWAFAESNDAVEVHSNWFSDAPAGQRLHVAVVASGAQSDGTGSVTMFVNGAPVLRKAYGPHGFNGIDGKKWIIGGSTYADMRSSGFFGEIGEARFNDHALYKDQWLTEHAGTCPGDSNSNSSGSSHGSSAGLSIVAVAAALGATVAALAHVNPKILPAWARTHVKRFQKFIASQK